MVYSQRLYCCYVLTIELVTCPHLPLPTPHQGSPTSQCPAQTPVMTLLSMYGLFQLRFLSQGANLQTKKDFIVDIDTIQSHGIGAADITKLKANGFYTVAVSIQSIVSYHYLTTIVRPWRNPKDAAEDQRLQRSQSRKGQRSNSEKPGNSHWPLSCEQTIINVPYSPQHQGS